MDERKPWAEFITCARQWRQKLGSTSQFLSIGPFTHQDGGHSDSSFLTPPSSQLNERKSKPVFLPPAFLLLILLASRSAPNPSQHVLHGRPSHRGPMWLSAPWGDPRTDVCPEHGLSTTRAPHSGRWWQHLKVQQVGSLRPRGRERVGWEKKPAALGPRGRKSKSWFL